MDDKAYFALLTEGVAWRIRKPTFFMRMFMRALGIELYSCDILVPQPRTWAISIYEWGKIKDSILKDFQGKEYE